MMVLSERRKRVLLRVQKERAADDLLKSAGSVRSNGRIWTQIQLNRKMRLENSRIPDLEVTDYCDDDDIVFMSMYFRLANMAKLNPMWTEIFRMHIIGCTAVEIAHILNIGRLRVCRIIRRCTIRLKKAYMADPYAGWYNVYLEEMRRR